MFVDGWKKKNPASKAAAPDLNDYPIREYVASMAAELAVLARAEGDLGLAKALDGAANIARRTNGTMA